MPIPTWDPKTGFLPPGEHLTSLDEIAEVLTWTYRRRQLMAQLRLIVAELLRHGVAQIWVNGSFVTTKPRPSDVDVVYRAKEGEDPNTWGVIAPSQKRRVQEIYQIDLWKWPSPQRKWAKGHRRIKPISEYFQSDEDDNPKGILILLKEEEA